MKEAAAIPGYPVYTRVYIYIAVLVIWYYRIIMITTRLLFILINNLIIAIVTLLSPCWDHRYHRYHLYYRYRGNARGAFTRVRRYSDFQNDIYAGQINKTRIRYIYVLQYCDRRLRYDTDEGDADKWWFRIAILKSLPSVLWL